MKLKLNLLVPEPLSEKDLTGSEVWNRSLDLELDQKYQVVAPSGTGKTTLLSILYGLRKDHSGDVLYSEFKTWSKLRINDVAIIFQDLNLLSDLTVLENIALKNQLTQHFSDEQILECLELLGVFDLREKLVGSLSRGEKQRVAIIRSLSMPFKFILLDEPFSHLDEGNTEKAIRLIERELNRNNAGLLMANLREDGYFSYDKVLHL